MESMGTNISLWSSLATIVGLLITVVALCISLYQTKKSQEHEGHLRLIAQSVSTEVIGPFPDYLEQIANLMSRATKSVDVLCAYPEHGHFSNIQGYIAYEEAMFRILRSSHIQVDLVFADKETRFRNDRMQFEKAHADIELWRKQHFGQLAKYIDGNGKVAREMGISGPDDIDCAETWHEFQEMCEQKAIEHWRDRDANVSVKECSELMPVFAWVIDKKEAIFAIMGYDDVLGYAIYTADKGFIEALLSLKDRYCRMCIETPEAG